MSLCRQNGLTGWMRTVNPDHQAGQRQPERESQSTIDYFACRVGADVVWPRFHQGRNHQSHDLLLETCG
jgi:hypothetical protein